MTLPPAVAELDQLVRAEAAADRLRRQRHAGSGLVGIFAPRFRCTLPSHTINEVITASG